jgi:hypothetical protein
MLELVDRLVSGTSACKGVGVRVSLGAPQNYNHKFGVQFVARFYNFMRWTSDLAYIVGLITTDGCLSKDGRHLDFTSKDLEQVQNFARILNLKNKVSLKKSSYNPEGVYYRIQFGNVILYRFLLKIGLMPNKSKTVGALKIPDTYYGDFLRGHLDGDGCTYSLWDSKWKNSFRLYLIFFSASKIHLEWIQFKIQSLYLLKGRLRYKGKSTYELKYAKKSTIQLLSRMYYKSDLSYLKRKYSKIMSALAIIGKH